MSKYFKLFNTTAEYNAYTADTSTFIKPNVSVCRDDLSNMHYNPLRCEETSVYEIVGTPSYPSTVDGADSSFGISVNYIRTDIDTACTETITEGTDTVTVNIGTNPSTSASRNVTGTVDYHGTEIEYSITQSKFETKITAKFNVTSTSNPTKILNVSTGFSSIEIDGVEQPSVITGYTFNTAGEHTIKYELADATNIVNSAFYSATSLTNITIPSGVTSIGVNAFGYCSGLTSIDIPDSVASIGNNAFNTCKSLTSCTIGSGVTSIGEGAFFQCSGLTSIAIPDSVTSIGTSGFGGCWGLTSVTIGSGVTTIVRHTFNRCTSLISIIIPDSVTSIGEGAFSGCSSMTSCTFGSGLKNIGSSAFTSCKSLTSIDIPSGVTVINDCAFKDCSGLTNVTIGSGVKNIYDYAFHRCYGLTSITSNATTAPTIQSYTFYDVKTGGTLTVPIGSSGYDVWMGTGNYYLGKYNWTKIEQ